MKKSIAWLISLFCFGLLLWLCIYSYSNFEIYYPSIHEFLQNPEEYNNRSGVIYGTIHEISPDWFILKSGQDLIRVVYSGARKNKFGQVTVLGAFKKDGFFLAESLHYNDYNYFKYILSAIGIFILLYLLFSDFRWNWKKFEFEPKNA